VPLYAEVAAKVKDAMNKVRTYLVGGAVRDKIMGYPFNEKDWVVTGSTVKDMLNSGFQQVGKDFPVFLHPKTKEEYALARTERKSGHGYHGFDVHAEPSVTLEQDLSRRDLTSMPLQKMRTVNLSIHLMVRRILRKKYYNMYRLLLPRIHCAFYV